MNVYQTNYDGVFVGVTTADPDPMDAGNWLIPAGCVTTAPPELGEREFAVWDGEAWRVETIPAPEPIPDPILAPDPVPDPEPLTIEQIRDRATLAKIDFCRALYAVQILPADLVVDAARGKWPTNFEAAIAGLPEAERVDAKLAWAGASHVNRTAPLFLSLLAFFANAKGLSPEQAETLGDQIFGVVA